MKVALCVDEPSIMLHVNGCFRRDERCMYKMYEEDINCISLGFLLNVFVNEIYGLSYM